MRPIYRSYGLYSNLTSKVHDFIYMIFHELIWQNPRRKILKVMDHETIYHYLRIYIILLHSHKFDFV